MEEATKEASTPTKDPYTTVCHHCPEGPTRKANGLFTPSQLRRRRPMCRACVSDRNTRRGRGRTRSLADKFKNSSGYLQVTLLAKNS